MSADQTNPTPGYPNLAGVATSDLVEQIPGSGFRASYINWSRTMQLLRDHAPGWLPFLEPVDGSPGEFIHRTPVGGFLLIGFEHQDGRRTATVPQAVMDSKNGAVPYDRITARDFTDTQRRGVCMAAAQLFGLAYELWAKMELETGYRAEDAVENIKLAGNREELEALLPDLATLPAREKKAARVAYAAREAELGGPWK